MSVLESFILGLVQGLTEFLPVSSSGHTVIAGKLLGIYKVPMAFELTVHLATLLAVIIVLRKDVFGVVKKPLGRDVRLILLSTVPTVIIVLLFRSVFEEAFSGEYLIYCFIVTALLLLVSGMVNQKRLIKPQIGYLDAAIIGVAQGIAAFPGISRSGSTIACAKLLGNDSENSTRFSFLISIPIIIGSAVVEFATNNSAAGIGALPLCVGFATSFLSGLLGAVLMTKVFARRSLDGFAIYLCLLSAFLLCNETFLHIF